MKRSGHKYYLVIADMPNHYESSRSGDRDWLYICGQIYHQWVLVVIVSVDLIDLESPAAVGQLIFLSRLLVRTSEFLVGSFREGWESWGSGQWSGRLCVTERDLDLIQ